MNEEKKETRRGFGQIVGNRRDGWKVRIPKGTKTASGRTPYAVKKFEKKKAAQAFIEAAEKAAKAGTLVFGEPKPDEDALTLEKAVDDYIAEQPRKSTRKGYESIARACSTPRPLWPGRSRRMSPQTTCGGSSTGSGRTSSTPTARTAGREATLSS